MAKSTTTASRTTRKTPARRTPSKAPTTKTATPETSAAPKAPEAKTAPVAATKSELPKVVKPAAADVVVPSNDGPEMKKRELIDLVVDRAGVKKKDAKPSIEAALAILGEAIASGRELNLQPLGKLRINRVEEKDNGRVIVCKLRQSNSTGPDEKEPLAEAAE
ncbi:transcriptional regulator HU subunit alpha [Falsiruegeria litorea R37]|uniref:Transcriptional regulator HU subunit alpha n=1 Tax=Falsiruegeria litorea R37 TaxID=1200284 RepID=A0A1Y5S8Z3_9RHOB|nr:HU family DNA-binding protein [Falsiruegeria litorea]SLN35219.1 transcriptional regulator HU subunit alpha [Falsiruegeria litorea R37]